MRRGGLTRLVQQLGITFVILELAHVPLPAPESHAHKHRSRPDEVCTNHGAPLHWRWAALDPEEADDEDALDLAAVQLAKAHSDCCGRPKVDCDVAATPRVRSHHHFVRGHSKGLHKSFAGRSTFVGLADTRAAGFHPLGNDTSRAPRAAMLQRWRC
ncbi:MAG TPA: hypothetical protein VGH33_14760 [Isosphaeraceae bacterium]|jgi:hypothetical protein